MAAGLGMNDMRRAKQTFTMQGDLPYQVIMEVLFYVLSETEVYVPLCNHSSRWKNEPGFTHTDATLSHIFSSR